MPGMYAFDDVDAVVAVADLLTLKTEPDSRIARRFACLDARRRAYVLHFLGLAEEHQRIHDEMRLRMEEGQTLRDALAVVEDRGPYTERQVRRILYAS